jgi:F-type H+-transporting ATPase subunit b
MDLLDSVNIRLFVAQGVIFLIVVAFLNKVLFKPILGLLHEREEKTEGFMRDAGEKEKAAESTLVEYQEKLRQARKEVLEVKKQYISEGTNTRTELLEKARKEANQSLEEIKDGIAKASEEARKALGQQTEALGKEVAEKVLRRSL